MNPSKNGSTASMTDVPSFTIMRVAFSSVNSWSNSNPSREKNSVDFFEVLHRQVDERQHRWCSFQVASTLN